MASLREVKLRSIDPGIDFGYQFIGDEIGMTSDGVHNVWGFATER